MECNPFTELRRPLCLFCALLATLPVCNSVVGVGVGVGFSGGGSSGNSARSSFLVRSRLIKESTDGPTLSGPPVGWIRSAVADQLLCVCAPTGNERTNNSKASHLVGLLVAAEILSVGVVGAIVSERGSAKGRRAFVRSGSSSPNEMK